MEQNATKGELDARLERFAAAMDAALPDWDTALILSRVNQYYFTGTMQDGMLVIMRGGGAKYFVRRSYRRAADESPLADIYPMESYRDAAVVLGEDLKNTCVEADVMTLSILERLKRTFRMDNIRPLDKIVLSLRAVKSPHELRLIERSGEKHDELLKNVAPALLKEGISEADFVAELFERMVQMGYHGVSRFSMFQTEMVVGQVGFGVSSIYPTSFDGPGGAYGMCPAAPLLGSRERKLKYGDLVFVDVGFGISGYHSDKTQVYLFGGRPTSEMLNAHADCLEIQKRLAESLLPGAIPSEIYHRTIASLDQAFLKNFMGLGDRRAKFLGHGVGLHVDEYPVLARGFDQPIQQNMVIALEPKKGLEGVGMVGVEDTYIVEKGGSRCVTGGGRGLIVI